MIRLGYRLFADAPVNPKGAAKAKNQGKGGGKPAIISESRRPIKDPTKLKKQLVKDPNKISNKTERQIEDLQKEFKSLKDQLAQTSVKDAVKKSEGAVVKAPTKTEFWTSRNKKIAAAAGLAGIGALGYGAYRAGLSKGRDDRPLSYNNYR